MATLINTSSGNINNYIWNVTLDNYAYLSGAPANTQSNSAKIAVTPNNALTFSSNISYCTFSGGYSVSHIGIKLAFGVGITNSIINGTFSVALGLVPLSGILTQSTIVANTRVDYNASSLPYYLSNGEMVSYPINTGDGISGSYGDRFAYYSYNTWLIFKLPQVAALNASSVYTILYTYTGSTLNSPYYMQLVSTYNTGSYALNSLLVTTATQSRNYNDNAIIAGEYYGRTSSNTWTMTMDATASAATFSNMFIGSNGILTFVTQSAYNPYLKLRGMLDIGANAIVNIGLSGSPIPYNSTARIDFSSTYSYWDSSNYVRLSDGIIIRMGGQLNSYSGATISYKANLSKTVNVGSKTASLATPINWSTGDIVALPPTETYNYDEVFTLTQNSSGLTVSLPSAASYTHSSTASYTGEIVNLSRNIKIGSIDDNYGSYILNLYGILNLNSTELYSLGFRAPDVITTATTFTYSSLRGGIFFTSNISASYSSTNIDNCSVKNTTTGISSNYVSSIGGSYIPTDKGYNVCNFTINNTIVYKLRFPMIIGEQVAPSSLTTAKSYWSINGYTSNIVNSFTNNIIVGGTNVAAAAINGSGATIGILQQDILLTNNLFTGMLGCSSPKSSVLIMEVGSSLEYIAYQNTIDNNTLRANYSGLALNNGAASSLSKYQISNFNIIKTYLPGITTIRGSDITLYNFNLLYNNTSNSSTLANVDLGSQQIIATQIFNNSGPIKFINSTFSNTNFNFNLTQDLINLKFINCFFNSTSGDFAFQKNAANAYSTNFVSPNSSTFRIFLDNCKSTSGVFLTHSYMFNSHSYIKTKNLNGVTGSFKSWYGSGIVEKDTSFGVNSIKASPSTQLVTYVNVGTLPISSTSSGVYLEASRKIIPVLQNKVLQVGVYVRKSKTSDGANYNGTQPRLMIGANSMIGITYDTLLTTGNLNNGIFEFISATYSFINDGVAEVWIECNGTTGWINVNEWAINYI